MIVPFRRFPFRAVTAVTIAAMVAGCVDQQGLPADCDEAAVARNVTLTGTELSPDAIEVCRGQDVTLSIDPDVDGVFHIHAYDEHVPATTVHTGEELTLEFPADRSGQFPIELHPAENPSGVTVGIFTVHEP